MAILPLSNVDKALMPQSPLLQEEDDSPIEIIIGDPEGEITDELNFEMDEEPSFDANLAEYMDGDELESLASDLLDDFDNDKNARKEWEQTYIDGLDLLGLKIEERTEPWNGACGVYHPMLAEAAIKFQSEMIAETFPAQGPVKSRIIGKETRENEEAAARVAEDMNYQLTEKMQEFRPEHEKMLWSLSLAGAAFKRSTLTPPSIDKSVCSFQQKTCTSPMVRRMLALPIG